MYILIVVILCNMSEYPSTTVAIYMVQLNEFERHAIGTIALLSSKLKKKIGDDAILSVHQNLVPHKFFITSFKDCIDIKHNVNQGCSPPFLLELQGAFFQCSLQAIVSSVWSQLFPTLPSYLIGLLTTHFRCLWPINIGTK